MTWIINLKVKVIGNVYDKLHNWLFPIDEYARDIVTIPRYNYINSVPFQKVVLDFLAWKGIDKKGNITSNRVYPTHIEILENQTALAKCGFSTGKYIEKLVVSEFLEMKERIPDLNPVLFAHFLDDSYHNSKLTKFTNLEAQKSNQTTKEYYDRLKAFLIEIQSFFEVEDLRTRIECNHTENQNLGNSFKYEEFITAFAKIDLNCDELGRFSMTYFINPHLKELIGESLGDTLEKRFEELTNCKMEGFIKMVPLNRRYDKWFKEIQTIPNYKVTVTEQNSL
ncbi:hypothetical protein [Chryseobacterium sp. ERMR1:04]|uniref:hypothetical protein n=1 Tax=Chryseobacterium sp. ERMR1:04 TaxID=1705393 RepID=UPI0006C8A693|nr:hypothetical protein [Chryseobacterium sp. ERMR1:04]KPH11694.1 hypothetical protein AMQ68_20165 [Chryseobacterium sp. ERMR1:04]